MRFCRRKGRDRGRSVPLRWLTPVWLAGTAMPVTAQTLAADDPPVIASVSLDVGGIFDLDNPEENGLLYRMANKAHINTQPEVIRQQLLFAPGDELSIQELAESERILRSNRYIQDASIEAQARDDNTVDVTVTTTDTWTLMPKLSYSNKGGASSTEIGFKEMNFLGRGIGLEAMYGSDVDRDTKMLKFVDRHLGDSWYSATAIIERNSDGYLHFLEFGEQFYALDTRDARGVSFFDNRRTDSVYDHGEVAAQYGHDALQAETWTGWSDGLRDGWVRRYRAGLAYDRHRFSSVPAADGLTTLLPQDREFLYPFLAVDVVQDSFEKSSNVDQIGRTEDRFTGTSFSARVGIAARQFVSDRDAVLFGASAGTTFGNPQASMLEVRAAVDGWLEADGLRNSVLRGDARYYRRQSDHRLFFAELAATRGHHLDVDQVAYLGGDNGLRGYPLRYQSGDGSVRLSLEQRFYTDWYPFRLFRVGAAVFFDAGRTWGESPLGNGSDGLLTNAGAGLRLGLARSGLGRVVHVDVAYPLNAPPGISNVQFVVELRQGF